MSWKDEIIRKDSEDFRRRMKERDRKNMKEGGGVDYNNPVHVTVEQILKEHGYGKEAKEVIERLKLRMKWLEKNAEFGGRD